MDKVDLLNAEKIYKYAVALNLNNSSENLSNTMDALNSGKISVKDLQIYLNLDRENAILKTISELIANNNKNLLNYFKNHNL